MHCPRCGQQQISDDTRFCSRCGMPLDLVAEVVANNGTLPQLEDIFKNNGKWLTRKNGFKLALIWFVTVVMLLLPLSGIADAPERVSGTLALLGFVGTILIMLLSWMFLPKDAKPFQNQASYQYENAPAPQFLSGQRNQPALPPQQSIPASDYMPPPPGSWRDTSDLQPTSVTDGTTKIFNEKKLN